MFMEFSHVECDIWMPCRGYSAFHIVGLSVTRNFIDQKKTMERNVISYIATYSSNSRKHENQNPICAKTKFYRRGKKLFSLII